MKPRPPIKPLPPVRPIPPIKPIPFPPINPHPPLKPLPLPPPVVIIPPRPPVPPAGPCVIVRPPCPVLPPACGWWDDYCPPLAQPDYRPSVCDLSYITPDIALPPSAEGVLPPVDATPTKWYLGVDGLILPDVGFGIEKVAEGSPAALAGLAPGMVILTCNELPMTSEESVQQALNAFDGVLEMTVQVEPNTEPVPATIQMKKIVELGF